MPVSIMPGQQMLIDVVWRQANGWGATLKKDRAYSKISAEDAALLVTMKHLERHPWKQLLDSPKEIDKDQGAGQRFAIIVGKRDSHARVLVNVFHIDGMPDRMWMTEAERDGYQRTGVLP